MATFALIAVLAAACTGSSSTPPTPLATEASAAPTPSAEAPTPAPSAAPTLIATPTGGGAGIETPPDAVLSVDGGDPVEGQLGTYVWAGGGSDSPWLPGTPIAATTGELLTVSLSPDLDVSDWSAALGPATSADGAGRVEVAAGPGPMQVEVPDAGAWTLAVTIRFGEFGSATWFWRLDVP